MALHDRSLQGPWTVVETGSEPDTAGPQQNGPCPAFPQFRGRSAWVWHVKDSNLRRLSRRLYSALTYWL
jgi:hypothetical protein